MIYWSEDSLWQKTRLLVKRAKQQPREGAVFAFWSTLALEMLARSVLASINPCLLADIRGDDRTVDNLFYACGLEIEASKVPISIAAKTVFSRCERLIPELVTHRSIREKLLTMRNEDVHSGGPGFQELEISEWIADYYQMCELLLGYRHLKLDDMFGKDEAVVADATIVAQQKVDKKLVFDEISKFKKFWDGLDSSEQDMRREAAKKIILKFPPNSFHTQVNCPSCSNKAVLIGIRAFKGSTRLEGNSLTQDVTALPEFLICNFCGLKITEHKNLRAAELGGEFTVSENLDPVEFHEIDIGDYVADYYEPEYGND